MGEAADVAGLGDGDAAVARCLNVAALQWDVRTGDVAWNLAAAEATLAEALAGGARLVVLPELWTTSFPGPWLGPDGGADGDLALIEGAAAGRAWARAASKRHGIVLTGTYLVPCDGPGGRFSNRLEVFDCGQMVGHYDKLHLFTPTAEHAVFEAGMAPPLVVETSVGCLGGVICYDLRFGELFGRLLEAGVEVIVCSGQWAAARTDHWRALVMGRAVECQATLVAANRTGAVELGRAGTLLEYGGDSLIADGNGVVSGAGQGQVGAVMGIYDRAAGRAMRVRVPVGKDRRAGVYAAWD